MKKRLLVFLTAIALATGLSAARPAFAHAEGGDNTAVAIKTKDGSDLFRLSFAIRRVMGDVVETTNAAVAYASCTDCTTTAIAIEIVLIQSDASTITPTNMAIAINELCTLCTTVAQAYQFVLTTGGNVYFDAEGNRILAEIRRRLEQLRNAQLTVADLQAELAAIKAQILDVLQNHLVAAGPSPTPTASPSTTTTTPTSTTQATTPTPTTETATTGTTTTEPAPTTTTP